VDTAGIAGTVDTVTRTAAMADTVDTAAMADTVDTAAMADTADTAAVADSGKRSTSRPLCARLSRALGRFPIFLYVPYHELEL